MWGLGPTGFRSWSRWALSDRARRGLRAATVSGAGAEPEAARLASVSRAASSQEPEPGPGEKTKSQRKFQTRDPLPTQGGPPPCSHAPRHLFPPPLGSLTITGLGLQLLLATQGLLICFLSSSDSWPSAAPEAEVSLEEAKGED